MATTYLKKGEQIQRITCFSVFKTINKCKRKYIFNTSIICYFDYEDFDVPAVALY